MEGGRGGGREVQAERWRYEKRDGGMEGGTEEKKERDGGRERQREGEERE